MVTAVLLFGGLLALVLGVAALGLLIKLVILPFRFALIVLKVAIAGVAAVAVLVIGLPIVAVLLLPLALAALVVWGTARLVLA